VPDPLPPKPSLEWAGELQAQFAAANTALGRLDGIASLLPETSLFLYSYVRKEAVLSSQIEGTQSSLSDLLLFENEQAPGVPMDDVQEVSNYAAALEHGLERIKEGLPLSCGSSRNFTPSCFPRGEAARSCRVNFGRAKIGWGARGRAMRVLCLLLRTSCRTACRPWKSFGTTSRRNSRLWSKRHWRMYSLKPFTRFWMETAGWGDCSSRFSYAWKERCSSRCFI
jgi:hypothetical protein